MNRFPFVSFFLIFSFAFSSQGFAADPQFNDLYNCYSGITGGTNLGAESNLQQDFQVAMVKNSSANTKAQMIVLNSSGAQIFTPGSQPNDGGIVIYGATSKPPGETNSVQVSWATHTASTLPDAPGWSSSPGDTERDALFSKFGPVQLTSVNYSKAVTLLAPGILSQAQKDADDIDNQEKELDYVVQSTDPRRHGAVDEKNLSDVKQRIQHQLALLNTCKNISNSSFQSAALEETAKVTALSRYASKISTTTTSFTPDPLQKNTNPAAPNDGAL